MTLLTSRVTIGLVIKSFGERDTERLFAREPVRRYPAELRRVMLRKLVAVDAAEGLDDLRVPPGNRLPGNRFWRERFEPGRNLTPGGRLLRGQRRRAGRQPRWSDAG